MISRQEPTVIRQRFDAHCAEPSPHGFAATAREPDGLAVLNLQIMSTIRDYLRTYSLSDIAMTEFRAQYDQLRQQSKFAPTDWKLYLDRTFDLCELVLEPCDENA